MNSRLRFSALFVLAILVAALAGASYPASAQNFRAVTSVSYGENGQITGKFWQIDAGHWAETDASGNVTFQFTVTERTATQVFLEDRSRGFAVTLDLANKVITFGQIGQPQQPLYAIMSMLTDALTASSGQSGGDAEIITGVRYIENGQEVGAFRQQQDGRWAETDVSGAVSFMFDVVSRDASAIRLEDRSRNVAVTLDLAGGQVLVGVIGQAQSPFYQISGTEAIGANPPGDVGAAAPAPDFSNVSGRDVTLVEYGENGSKAGDFRQTADGQKWVETDAGGNITFKFTERSRTKDKVVLRDAGRGLDVVLDLANGQVTFGNIGAGQQKLATILNAQAGDILALPDKPVEFPQNDETQCVKNIFGTGIVAKVRWYKPYDFQPDEDNPGEFKLIEGREPTQQDTIIVTQRSCIQAEVRMTAIVSVVGHEVATHGVKFAAGTLIAIGGAVACVGTEGAACPAVAALISSIASGGASFIPDAVDVFYAGAPGQLEVTGTAYNPSAEETRPWGTGKLVGEACEWNADCRNNQCGRMTASDEDFNRKVCCPSGSFALPYATRDYCDKMVLGASCWSDAQCGSGDCVGNLGGLQRGTCQ